MRPNRVLRAFAKMHLSGLIAGPDANRYVDQPATVLAETLRREEDVDDEGDALEEKPAEEEAPVDAAPEEDDRPYTYSWEKREQAKGVEPK